jgi:hypothetical protein
MAFEGIGKMVYSAGGTGKMMYSKGGTGKMVYRHEAYVDSGAHAYRRKYGDHMETSESDYPDEDTVMALAEAEMQGSEWGSVSTMFKNQTQHSTLTSPTRYRTNCITEMGGRSYQIGDLTGLTLDRIRISVTNTLALSFQVKVITVNSTTWDYSWADVTDDPQYVGSGAGDIEINIGFVALTYVRIFLVADPVVAPTPPAGNGSTSEEITWSSTVRFWAKPA